MMLLLIQKLDKVLKEKGHWVRFFAFLLALFAFLGLKPEKVECERPAPPAQIAQIEADQE